MDSPGWSLQESPPFSLCETFDSLREVTGFSQITLAQVFARVDSQTRVEILALVHAMLQILHLGDA